MSGNRATQLRARFVQPGGHLRVVWFISNTSLRLDELVDDATPDVADVLVELRLQLDGPASWHAEPDGEPRLVLDVLAHGWTDPRRDTSRRSTTPEGIS